MFIEGFLSGRIAVNCQTKEEAIEFFRWCREEHNIKWSSGRKLDEEGTQWELYDKTTAYRIGRDRRFGLMHGNINYYNSTGKPVMRYDELFEGPFYNDFEPASDSEFKAFLSAN